MQLAWEQGWDVDSYSGVSSATMALELSGFTSTPMSFHGFSSREGSKQKEFLKKDLAKRGSHIWFEPPHRVEKVLHLLKEIWPENEIFIGRELTKTYQSLHRFKLKNLDQNEIVYKGEFALVLSQKSSKKEVINDELIELAEDIKLKGPAQKKVAKLMAKILGLSAKELYGNWNKEK